MYRMYLGTTISFSFINGPRRPFISLEVGAIANARVLLSEGVAEEVKAIALVDRLSPITNYRTDGNTTLCMDTGRFAVLIHVVVKDLFELIMLLGRDHEGLLDDAPFDERIARRSEC